MRHKKLLIFPFLIFFIFTLTTCGLDDLPYIPPVEFVQMQFATNAIIYLPSTTENVYIREFAIFYRIYLSNSNVDNVSGPAERVDVSQQLETDFNYFDNTFIRPVNAAPPTANSFTSRNYYKIIPNSSVLTTGSKEIQIIFNSGEIAKITHAGIDYPFYRNYRESNLIPADGFFYYHDDLLIYNDLTGPGREYNRDVFGTTNTGYSSIYVSMYIVTEGVDNNFQILYSRPKHIGVFRISP